jgi:hypothetical protein
MPETAPLRKPHRNAQPTAGLPSLCGRRSTTVQALTGISRSTPALHKQLQNPSNIEKGWSPMSRLTKAIRSHRDINRTRRELNRAIANASTPAMRDELILVAQRGGNVL